MKDRVPLYPGRVTLTPVSGQANTYDLTRADQPTQEGTPLNKASLLKDATAALYGLPNTAVPDDVLSKIKPLIDSANANANTKARIATGSYTGTGTYGSSNPNSLTFDFEPSIVIVYGEGWSNIYYAFLFKGSTISNRFSTTADENGNIGSRGLHINFSGSTVSWYSTIGYTDQLNASEITYKYIAIG